MNPQFKTETYERFRGIDNINDTTKLISRETIKRVSVAEVRMIQAQNVDCHSDFHYSRSKGYALSKAGAYTSVWSNGKTLLGVLAGNLYQIHDDFSTTFLLGSVGSNEMSYESVSDGSAEVIYFTNGTVIGKVKNGVVSSLRTATGDFKANLPPGNLIRYFLGSLYVVAGKVMYISDVLNREIYDRRWGFKLFESEITLFEAVQDGFFTSDKDNAYFMQRKGSTQEVAAAPIFTLTKLCKGAVPGTGCRVENVTSPSGKTIDKGVIWVSGNTLCLGGDGGVFEEIRSDVYAVPSSRIGTSMVRKSGDLNQYITIVR